MAETSLADLDDLPGQDILADENLTKPQCLNTIHSALLRVNLMTLCAIMRAKRNTAQGEVFERKH